MAKAKGSGRKKGGWMRVRKTREVKPDGAHAYSWPYQARIADALAAKRDAELTAEAQAEAAQAAEKARTAKAEAEVAAKAQRLARLAPRPCKRCETMLPSEAFERHPRAYNGRMGCCRPCAEIIRARKAAPQGRREKPAPKPRPCRHCEEMFTPVYSSVHYCREECRTARQKARHAAQHREAYYANWERRRQMAKEWKRANPEKRREHRRAAGRRNRLRETAAHAVYVARNRDRINAYQREYAQRRAAILNAKEHFEEAGFFLLIRAQSGFWRVDAPGRRIGATETIMARLERVLTEWVVLPPVIATPETLKFATRLRLAEQRRKARRYVPSVKTAA